MIRALTVLALAASLWSGCKSTKVHCDQLVRLACEQVENQKDGVVQCDHIEEQAKAISDEECMKTLRLLEETGKLKQKQQR